MQRKVWFKAKRYGWGWYPVTWQGWLILVVYVFILINIFREIDSASHSVSDTLINFLPQTVIVTAILILICYMTGEKLRWRWGK
ncbi:MAG: hypothetical protein Q7S32_04450 [bacterium]|nr:hypothetical protein [bacterium]